VITGQGQNAGDGAQQFQARGNMVINQGISEERVRNILKAETAKLIADYTSEATHVIETRLAQLDDRVVTLFAAKDALDSFADPAFIRSLRKAQNGAAATERETDYDMLAALLAERSDNPRDRRLTTGIDRAIEIVDQVDDTALRALTVLQATLQWIPTSGDPSAGLDAMDRILTQLLDGPLPTDFEWIDHLDILDAVRLNPVSNFKPFDEYYPQRMLGYAAAGLPEEESASHPYAHGPFRNYIVDHPYRKGFQRVHAANEGTLRDSLRTFGVDEAQIDEFAAFAREKMGLGQPQPDAMAGLITAMHERSTLDAVAAWWATFPNALTITTVGKSLAVANAYRLDTNNFLPRNEQRV